LTRDIKDVIQTVLQNINDVDIEEIITYLKAEKPEALLSFIGRIAPKDLNVKGEISTQPIAISVKDLKNSDVAGNDE